MAKVFEFGEVVRLNSGGPKMTVSAHESGKQIPGMVLCIWFEPTFPSEEGQLLAHSKEEAWAERNGDWFSVEAVAICEMADNEQ